MSHFSVLVIGDDVDKQLAPYHEFECTGINDQYIKNLDVTQEAKASFNGDTPSETFLEFCEGYYGYPVVEFGNSVEIDGEHQYGYIQLSADGEVEKVIKRTNPDAQWYWYVIGGRWSGFIKSYKGLCNQARKGEVDFEGMCNDAGFEAQKSWDEVNVVTEGEKWRSWEEVRDAHAEDIEAAREEYHAQPAIKRIMGMKDGPFFDIDQFLAPRDEFIANARNRAIATYAVVKDGKWYAKGKMGWFGMSNGEVTQDEWNAKVNELLDSLPDDTLLTVVDCHI